jgi:hypothetical protein
MHKLSDLVKVTGEIDTVDDMEKVRDIVTEEAKKTCEEYRKGGMRNHDENVDSKEEGKKFFEVSLKRWNDKATGKIKDKPTVKSDRKSNVTEETMVEASFGVDNYEVPKKDRHQMMMDFYFLVGASQMPLPEFMHGDPEQDFKQAISFALGKIVDHVKIDLSAATFFAICAEIRHVFARNEFRDIRELIEGDDTSGNQTIRVKTVKEDSPDFKLNIPYDVSNTKKFQKIWKDYTVSYAGLQDFDAGPSDERLIGYGDFGIKKGSSPAYIKSWKAAKNATKGNDIDFAELAKFCYLKARWNSSYGGDAWAGIAHFYIEVAKSTSLNDKIHNIDKLFSLQHNTGTVLNKVKEYSDAHGNFGWIAKALDFKFNVREFMDYHDKVSPSLKRLAIATSRVIDKKTLTQKKKEDEPGIVVEVGDIVRHEDLGYLGGIPVVKILKKTDPEHGRLVKLKNTETGKTFNSFEDKLTLVPKRKKKTEKHSMSLPPKGGLGSMVSTPSASDYPKIDTDKYDLVDGTEVKIGNQTAELVKYLSADEVQNGHIVVLKSEFNGSPPRGTTGIVRNKSGTDFGVDWISSTDAKSPKVSYGQILHIVTSFYHTKSDSSKEFKVGDKVKITNVTFGSLKQYNGKTGEIVYYESNTGTFKVKFDDTTGIDASSAWFNKTEIEHVENGESEEITLDQVASAANKWFSKQKDDGKDPSIEWDRMMKKFGAKKLADIPPTDYQKFLDFIGDDSIKATLGEPVPAFGKDKEDTEFTPVEELKKGDKVKVVQWHDKKSPVLGSTGEFIGIHKDGRTDYYQVQLDTPVEFADQTIRKIVLISDTQVFRPSGNNKVVKIADPTKEGEKFKVGDKVQVSSDKRDLPVGAKQHVGEIVEIVKVGEDFLNVIPEGESKDNYFSVSTKTVKPIGKNVKSNGKNAPTKEEIVSGKKFYKIFADSEVDPDRELHNHIGIVQKIKKVDSNDKWADKYLSGYMVKVNVHDPESGELEDTLVNLDLTNLIKLSKDEVDNEYYWLYDAPGFDVSFFESIDFSVLHTTEDLQEYFVALEGIMNRIEYTGGKRNKQKTAGCKGKRVDRGSRGALGRRTMSLRERANRKRGATRGNVKSRGKLAAANKKKIAGQKLNPNSPTGKF